MKRITYIALLCALAVAGLVGCGEDRTHEYLDMTEENQWTYSRMKEVYLWADSIKKPSQSDFFANTSKFFTLLKYKGDNVSYFADSVSLGSYGMTFAIMRDPIGERPSKVYALVLFVEEGSPAYTAGVERGTWITGIDGRSLSTSSAPQLQQGGAIKLTTEQLDYNDESGRYCWAAGDTVPLSQSQDIATENICIDTTYAVRDHNVGYMLVNSFDGEDFCRKSEAAIDRFAAEGVTKIIIDLRYCTGGSISNAVYLASSLVPSNLAGTPFCTLNGNSGEADTIYSYRPVQLSLGNSSIYFIVSGSTKGTAELLVNSINASRGANEVYILGERTAGANVMVERFESPYGFAINPATAYVMASNGVELPVNGTAVDYNVNELGNIMNIHSLGSEQEYMLYNTLYLIANGSLPSEAGESNSRVLVPDKKCSFAK